LKPFGFIFAIFIAIGVAYLFPQGIELLPLKTITDIGIGLIFFLLWIKIISYRIQSRLN